MNRLCYLTIRSASKYLSPFIKGIEHNQIIKYAKLSSENQPIFIIGTPRSGSTLLYQLLTNTNELLYINNLINLFHRNLFTGFRLSDKFLGRKSHNCFKSELGNTLKCGWNGPSESGNFWYNWLDRRNGYEENNNIDECAIDQIRNVLLAIINKYQQPLLIKNLYNSQRLPLLAKIFPNCKIIWIKRDHNFTAQSIINARKKLKVPNDSFWSISPHGIKSITFQNEYDLVATQIKLIEKQIIKDSKYIFPENLKIINYENIQEELANIFQFCGIKNSSIAKMKSKLKTQNTITSTNEEWGKIKQAVQKTGL